MPEAAAHIPRQYYKFLSDLSAELDKGAESAGGLEALLLTALGSLGGSSGFGWSAEDGSSRERWIARGISPAAAAEWEKLLPRLLPEIRPESYPDGARPAPFVGIIRELPAYPRGEGTGGIRLLLYWAGNGVTPGFLGLGPKLRHGEYSEEEKEILFGLIYHFLQRTASPPGEPSSAALRSDLAETRRELEGQRKNRDKLQAEFDRQIFYLKTLYDISAELADQGEAQKMLEAFLLMILGTFGFEEGFIQLYDRPENRTLTVHRGAGSQEYSPLPPEELLGFIPPGETSADSPAVRILSRSDFRQPDLLPPALLKGHRFAFALPEGFYGFLALGGRLTSREIDRREQELLQTLLFRLLAALAKVKASENILRLNRELEEKNTRLEKTVQELTRSRSRIEVLEKAKTQIKAVIQHELERSRRVSLTDVLFILILGAVLGLIYNLANPGGITVFSAAWFGEPLPAVTPALAKGQIETGQARLIDARPEHFFRQHRLRGALNLPLTLFDFVYLMKIANLPPEQPLIVYGRNFSRRYDREVGLKLKSKGHTRIAVLTGDWTDWRRAGLITEP
ncbi:MAG: rhodanese-like domain-containing protein [Deltaproteobacteria bacterium]|nr:rhodanese-like domain-containing protein [Deltaproteobacteria bacterium]